MEVVKTEAEQKAEKKRWQELADKERADMLTLPFIRDCKKGEKRKNEFGRWFWSVEPTGDFDTDSATGQEYGVKFCEHVTKFPRGSFMLGWIVRDMIEGGEFGRIEISFLYVVSTALSYGAIFTPDQARVEAFFKKTPRRKKRNAPVTPEPLKLVK